MRLVSVIPITKGIFKDQLSYFTSKEIGIGDMVTIPLRNKNTPAIVASLEDIKKIKSDLRRIEFSIKPIKDIRSGHFFMPKFMEASREIAEYFISPLGSAIKDLASQAVLENPQALSVKIPAQSSGHEWHEITILQAPQKERTQNYKSIIREEFAKNKSVFFCLPTIAGIEEQVLELQKGIENYTVVLHAEMTKKKIRENWGFALTEPHPLLIVATRSFLSIPRHDLGTLIVDQENSPFYKLQNRPYLDVRKAAEIISKNLKIRLIFGDDVVSAENFYRNKSAMSYRMLSEAEQITIDMKKGQFQIISPELKKNILSAIEKNEITLLFVNRRGYAPVTVCNDCQRVIMCDKCDSPLVLHKEENKKDLNLKCHKCLTAVSVSDQCPICKGWRLEELGIGIQKTAEEILKEFPRAKIFRMDSDTIKTKKTGEKMAEEFYNSPGGILIGTEIIFSYLKKPVARVGVVSIDAMFTLPNFRINEKIFQLLLKLRGLAKKTFLIQTRLPEEQIFDDAMKGNVSGFYREELEKKKQFDYPPFKTIIKITRESKNKAVLEKETNWLTQRLLQWNPVSYPAFIPKIKGVYIWHIILKLEPETWPSQQKELHGLLSSLDPSWKINVSPESLL